MKVSVIIPNYNGEILLKENLPKVLECGIDGEIIVVDDASIDASIATLHDLFPQVKVIKKEKNEGFASSVNEGINSAKYNLILLINSDVIPEKYFIRYLIPHFADSHVFAVGCCQKSMERGRLIFRGRGIGVFQKGFLMHQRGEIDKNTTLWVSGGAGMFRKDVWKKLGGMDTLYNPFYWEDIDLSYRALKAGYKILFEPKSIVSHCQERGTIKKNRSEKEIKSIAYRNQIIFVWLNITNPIYLLEHIILLPYYLLHALITLDIAFIDGFYMAVKLIPKIWQNRQKNKMYAKMSDQNVLKNLSA